MPRAVCHLMTTTTDAYPWWRALRDVLPWPDRLCAHFAEQFAPHGTGFVYRRERVGAAIPVTIAERDAMVVAFNDRAPLLALFTSAVLLAPVVVAIALDQWDMERLLLLALTVVAPGLAIGALVRRQLFAAPARAFAGRAPVADALDRRTRHLILHRDIGYGHIVIAAYLAWYWIDRLRDAPGEFGFWGDWAYLLPLGCGAQALYLAWRRWQYDRAVRETQTDLGVTARSGSAA